MSGFRDAGLQRPLNRRLGEVLGGVGVSTIGNTAGTTGTVFGPVVLAGISGVTLSQSTRGNQATITILASAEAGVAIGAGTQTQATGTVLFSNSNNVSFGLSNGTLTASAGAGLAIGAGTQTGSTGTIAFADSNGITFGMSGSNQITASHNAVQSVGAQDFGGGAGLNVGVPRWVWASSAGYNVAFSKSVNGVSGSILARAQAVAAADSAGTQTSGTVIFSNANGVSFGLNAGTMTASVDAGSMRQISFWDASALKHNNVQTAQVTRLILQRINIPNPIAATGAQLMMFVSNSNNAGGTVAFSFGVYTMSGSTASLASSASRTWAYNSTLAGSSYTDIQLTNYRSMTLGTWSLSQGDYLFALQVRITTALTSGTYNWLGGEDISIAGYDYGTGPVSYFNHGKYSASTGAFPATIHPTQIQGAQFSAAFFFPYFQLIGTH